VRASDLDLLDELRAQLVPRGPVDALEVVLVLNGTLEGGAVAAREKGHEHPSDAVLDLHSL
jgi:hypothetical protein